MNELEEYACDIDRIPRNFVQELVIADGENLNKLQGNKPARYWMDSFFYQNPYVDVLYVIRHCQKNVETLYETIFNYNRNTDNIKTLLMADAKIGALLEEYASGIAPPVPDALRIQRKHPNLINLEIMPTDKFSKQQWQSLQAMHPDNPNLTKAIKMIL